MNKPAGILMSVIFLIFLALSSYHLYKEYVASNIKWTTTNDSNLRIGHFEANDEPGEYIEIPVYDSSKDLSMFGMIKEILCSDNPYAKELVERYKIASDTIKCPSPGDHPKSTNPTL